MLVSERVTWVPKWWQQWFCRNGEKKWKCSNMPINETVDGWNPAPVEVGSLYSVYTTIYRVLYIQGGAGFQPSTVVTDHSKNNQTLDPKFGHNFDFPNGIFPPQRWPKIKAMVKNKAQKVLGRKGIFTYRWMVDLYGKLVGKCTVRPRDAMGLVFASFDSLQREIQFMLNNCSGDGWYHAVNLQIWWFGQNSTYFSFHTLFFGSCRCNS